MITVNIVSLVIGSFCLFAAGWISGWALHSEITRRRDERLLATLQELKDLLGVRGENA